MLNLFRIDRRTSYKEANLINKIDRKILKWRFEFSYSLGRLTRRSGTYFTHPECNIEHPSREDMSHCKIRTFSTFTESRYIDKIVREST